MAVVAILVMAVAISEYSFGQAHVMTRSLIPLSVLVTLLYSGSPVCAQTTLGGATGSSALIALRDSPSLGVQDHAGMFSLNAVLKAREAIQQFRLDFHRDLFVETFERVPAADQQRIRSLNRKSLEQFFSSWATSRATTIGIDGVYILICKEPRQVYVLIYPHTPEQPFTEDNGRDLRRLLERQLPKAPDGALADAVTLVRTTVTDNLAERQSASTSIRFETVALIVAGIVGFWLLLSLVRAVLPQTGGDPTHAGRTSGFFGALFGTTAGHWVYDRLFRAHPPAVQQPESDFLHSPPPAAEEMSDSHTADDADPWKR